MIVPWNIISYNLFSKAGGPKLYGTEPWYYYLLNGALNANILLPLALLSVPAVLLTAALEPKRLLITKPGQSSAAILLAMRALPFYIWFGILSVQPHKEERFMFPAFPLICSNAALTLGLVRGAMEALYVKVTRAPFRVGKYCAILVMLAEKYTAGRPNSYLPLRNVSRDCAYLVPINGTDIGAGPLL